MLGGYRLCLALLVALSHAGVSIAGFNPGVFAVVGFYVVSGYVMTGLLRNHYPTFDVVPRFYADRVLRIFPHYLAIASVTLAWFVAAHARTDYLRAPPDAIDLVRNLLVIPLNFYMFNQADHFTLIPPAWSLGAELQFYLVIPFVLLAANGRLRPATFTASVAIFTVAAFGVINSDWFGYRLLPGVLCMFLLGSWLYDLHQTARWRAHGLALWGAVVIVAALLGALLAVAQKLQLPYNREALLGAVAGVAAVHLLAHRPRHPVDEAAGNISYGVFLNHFLVMWVLFGGTVSGWSASIVYLAASVAFAWLMYSAVERPVLALRRALRVRGAARAEAVPTEAGTGGR